MKTGKITVMALAIALAMVLSFVESQIPAFVAVPGVKVGLANIAVVFVLYKLGWKEAVVISLVRVFMVSLLFGSIMSLFYSVAGGVLHNVGQIAMACVILETNVIKYYLPFLVFSGVVAGIVVGLVAAVMIKRVNIKL